MTWYVYDLMDSTTDYRFWANGLQMCMLITLLHSHVPNSTWRLNTSVPTECPEPDCSWLTVWRLIHGQNLFIMQNPRHRVRDYCTWDVTLSYTFCASEWRYFATYEYVDQTWSSTSQRWTQSSFSWWQSQTWYKQNSITAIVTRISEQVITVVKSTTGSQCADAIVILKDV